MDLVMIVLRLVHILAGVFWAGAAFATVGFILPAARRAGPAGGQYILRLLQMRFSQTVVGAGTLNVLAGLLLYWRDSGGLQLAWITTPTGLVETTGALAALASLVVGGAITVPAAVRLERIGGEVERGGKPPTPEQGGQIGGLQARLGQAAQANALLLAVAVLCMAIMRYV